MADVGRKRRKISVGTTIGLFREGNDAVEIKVLYRPGWLGYAIAVL